MPKRGHRPQRSCLGCGNRDDQDKLIRLIGVNENKLMAAKTGGGRGGYLHHARVCWRAFLGRKNLRRAFRVEISKGAMEKFISELQGPVRE